MKTTIEKQVAAANRRIKKFIDDSFVDLQLEMAKKFAEARQEQSQSGKK